jgi:hypothetical protein
MRPRPATTRPNTLISKVRTPLPAATSESLPAIESEFHP